MSQPLTEIERRDAARRHLDSAERWLRRIINHQLVPAFGTNYWNSTVPPEPSLIPQRIRTSVERRMGEEPTRWKTEIDATTLGELIDIALHPELYPRYFREPLAAAYPDGPNEARTFLSRLQEHRNRLAHGDVCGDRCLEQCACYSNDLIDSLKAYLREKNMERAFNVPTFTRVVDNKGNRFDLNARPDDQGQFIDIRSRGAGDLHVGDQLMVEVEIDESFSGYTVFWQTFTGDSGGGSVARLTIERRHVQSAWDIRFRVVSSEEWHRLRGCDDMLDLRYRVLPPI